MKRKVIIPVVIVATFVLSAPSGAQRSDTGDPFLWLEEVDGKRAMDWVNAKNSATIADLTKAALYQPIFDRTKEILDSRDRIVYPQMLGNTLYNFWQDASHERGIWRRTTWDSYLSGNPQWETVLDVDALAREENVPWAYGGASCLQPDYRRCLVALSRGGSDATEVREFDLRNRRFVENGFKLQEAKSSFAWIDENTILVGTDFGPGSMTTSGYARVVKQWKRGTPLSSATTVLEIPQTDMGLFTFSYDAGGRKYFRLIHNKNFYERTQYLFEKDKLVELDVPNDVDTYLVRDQLILYVRTPYTASGKTWETGSLIAMNVDSFLGGKRDFQLVMKPGARETMNGISATRDYLLVNVLNNVRGELRRYSFSRGSWTFDKVAAPDLGSIGVVATSTSSNRYFFNYTNFIQPTTLFLGEADGKVREIKRLPAMFDAKGLIVEQLEATSRDGTKVPFFVVRRDSLVMDGRNPTLLYAYGGFEVSLSPSYSSTIGAAWLERGGVYVSANIRGGGEFGPEWHRSALKENRQRAYDDFAAVAEELIRRKITSPSHLGIMGGSNGGLLVGVAFTQRPDLYNAVVVQVPLLDMRRYNKLLAGASWMAEYGDPDKEEEWAFISKYSPYQNVRPGVKYPKVMFTTTTRDDRVHPGHARKMAAKMEDQGHPLYYFENTEGGHGSGVTSEQRARTMALTYAYLWQQLGTQKPSM